MASTSWPAFAAAPAADARSRLAPRRQERRIRLQTLVLLRWLAVAGQLLAVLLVYGIFEYELPLGPCMAAIAASAWLNVFLSIRYRRAVRVPEWQAASFLGFDLGQLAVLLYLTGGLENPFALLFLVPVTVSATTLSARATILLLGLAISLITLLGIYHLPLPWRADDLLELPFLYKTGIWTALVLGLTFTAAYAWRIAQESRRMSDALAATQLVMARAQRLTALDGLAAAAAHELGTPLGTIALVTKELQRAGVDDPQMREDLALLHSQAKRCKEILSRLADEPEQGDMLHSRLPLHVLLDEVVGPHRGGGIEFDIQVTDTSEPGLMIARRPEMLYGLGNLVENAADFADAKVVLTATVDADNLHLSVVDDGPGLAPEIIDRLGEPYVTSRARRSVKRDDHDDSADQGMGLGFFIAKTLLERTGAQVTIANRADAGGPGNTRGAEVQVTWVRADIEAEKEGIGEGEDPPPGQNIPSQRPAP